MPSKILMLPVVSWSTENKHRASPHVKNAREDPGFYVYKKICLLYAIKYGGWGSILNLYYFTNISLIQYFGENHMIHPVHQSLHL